MSGEAAPGLNSADAANEIAKTRSREVFLIVTIASFVALVEPLTWLGQVWSTPGFHPTGPVFAALACGLLLWSVRSGGPVRSAEVRRGLLGVWLLAMLLRLISRALAIDVLGGMLLVADAYLLGRVLRLSERPRPVHASGIALLVGLALPFERILQRVLGHPLSWASAELSCGAGSLAGLVECDGMQVGVGGAALFVDAPCSGVQGLYLLAGAAFFALAVSTRRGSIWRAFGVVPLAALIVNSARLLTMTLMLSHGSGLPDPRFEPWHSIVGALWLALGAAVVFRYVRGGSPVAPFGRRLEAQHVRANDEPSEDMRGTFPQRPGLFEQRVRTLGSVRTHHKGALHVEYPYWGKMMLAMTGLAAAVSAAAIDEPECPPDVSAEVAPLSMPSSIEGYPANPLPLSAVEANAYGEHGGEVARIGYGDHVLLVARTTSPLRHLHDPVECLRAMGIRATRLGVSPTPTLHGVYQAIDTDGVRWNVGVVYVGPAGSQVTSVSAVVWRWLSGERGEWTQIQWISPQASSREEQDGLAFTVRAFFDLQTDSEG